MFEAEPKALFRDPEQVVSNRELMRSELVVTEKLGPLLLRILINAYNISRNNAPIERYARTYQFNEVMGQISPVSEPTITEVNELLLAYRLDPKRGLAVCRSNFIELCREQRIPESERLQFLKEILRVYFKIIVKLDQYAFPPDGENVIHRGVPAYIPDGLSDMGSDPRLNPEIYKRERIHINKAESYVIAFQDICDTIWSMRHRDSSPSSDHAKAWIIQDVMARLYVAMPYRNEKSPQRNQSINIHEVLLGRYRESVCRHIALETQLRLQALGIESRLLKCTLDGERHVANLVRVNGQWHLIDTTNPEIDPEKPVLDTTLPAKMRVYCRPIQLSNSPTQSWTLTRYVRGTHGETKEKSSTYTSHNEMYYRVLHNHPKVTT